MADKYNTLVNGKETLREATDTSTGVPEAGDIVALDSTGKLDGSLFPTGIGPDVQVAEAAVNINVGSYVNFFDDLGTLKVRLADKTNNRPAHGFASETKTTGEQIKILFEGPNTNFAGLTAGDRQYLDVNGIVTTTPTTTSGHIHQLVGVAVSPTSINTDIQDCVDIE